MTRLWLNDNFPCPSLFFNKFLSFFFNSRTGKTNKMNFWTKIKILIFFRLPIDFPFVLHFGSHTSSFVFLIQLKTLYNVIRPKKNQIKKGKKSKDKIERKRKRKKKEVQ